MKKTEIFAEILDVVSQATEIPANVICSRNKETGAVDARSVLVKLLCEEGVYPNQIADLTGLTPACVRRLPTDYEHRCSINKMIGRYMQHIRNVLASKH